MFPTFDIGDQLLVNKLSQYTRGYQRRDVVVFNPSDTYISMTGNKEALIKRIIAIAGDTLEVKDNRYIACIRILYVYCMICMYDCVKAANTLTIDCIRYISRIYLTTLYYTLYLYSVYVNGIKQDEPYIAESPEYSLLPLKVPSGFVLVLGRLISSHGV